MVLSVVIATAQLDLCQADKALGGILVGILVLCCTGIIENKPQSPQLSNRKGAALHQGVAPPHRLRSQRWDYGCSQLETSGRPGFERIGQAKAKKAKKT